MARKSVPCRLQAPKHLLPMSAKAGVPEHDFASLSAEAEDGNTLALLPPFPTGHAGHLGLAIAVDSA